MTTTTIPPDIASRLQPFFQALREIAGKRLLAVCLSGSAVTPDYLPGISDLNTVIVLRELDLKFLQQLAPLGKKFSRRKIAAPLLITPDYIDTSLDVFPIEFLDLQLRHLVIEGPDLFQDLAIRDCDLRLQCEREIKARIIGLRQDYLAATGQRQQLAQALSRAFTSLMPVCRGIVRLYGQKPPVPIRVLLERLATVTAADTSSLEEIHARRRQQQLPDMAHLNLLFGNFYRLLERLGQLLDELQT